MGFKWAGNAECTEMTHPVTSGLAGWRGQRLSSAVPELWDPGPWALWVVGPSPRESQSVIMGSGR